jgi:hypothetical protein
MRTSLNEIKKIEDHLQGNLAAEENLLIEVRKLIDHSFATNLTAQQDSYKLIRSYGRKQLRQEIESIHQQLFREEKHYSFRKMIFSLFERG